MIFFDGRSDILLPYNLAEINEEIFGNVIKCFYLYIMKKVSDYIKANRKGSRDAELSFEGGWKAKLKVHPSKKTYSRKSKHKK